MIKNGSKKNMTECDKRKSHISSKLHMTNVSSNNVRHSVTKTFSNVLIQFFLSSTCFEHLMFIFRKTIFYMQFYRTFFMQAEGCAHPSAC